MNNFAIYQQNIFSNGFTFIQDIFGQDEIAKILTVIESTDQSNPTFLKTDDLFAIRQFLKEVPQIKPLVFNSKLKTIINDLFGNDYFLAKSIYFDKPEKSNWFVAWHQDLTISVDKRVPINGYGPWTVKHNQFA